MSVRLGCVLYALATMATCGGVADAENSPQSTGSGIVVSATGDILTNAHVVEDCETITVRLPTTGAEAAVLAAKDKENDLAIVHIKSTLSAVALFRDGAPIRLGDQVIVLGYPLAGVLASSANLSVGVVSALAGLRDDSRFLQISAPVQPGNSGGPLLDASGHLVGIVTSKLNAMELARYTGDIAQNVNFAIKAEVAKAFLDSRGIKFGTARSDQQMPVADVADAARPFTVYIECRGSASARNDATSASNDAAQSDSLESHVADFIAALFAGLVGTQFRRVANLEGRLRQLRHVLWKARERAGCSGRQAELHHSMART